MKVIARSSSFRYKGKSVDLQEAGRALRVKAIVTGRVAQSGDNLVIGVELVDTADLTQIWGEQYNRKATDLLQVQADISGDVAEKLRRRLSGGERDQLTKRETRTGRRTSCSCKDGSLPEAVGHRTRRKRSNTSGRRLPSTPTTRWHMWPWRITIGVLVGNSVLDPKEYMPKGEAAVRKALELDERLAEAQLPSGISSACLGLDRRRARVSARDCVEPETGDSPKATDISQQYGSA